MENLRFEFDKAIGKVKPMNCMNNGPCASRGNGNSSLYEKAGIPFARNHDASFCSSYGGHRTVDVAFIFSNFDADANDPASYDFPCTDKYVADTYAVGTKMYYRLGTKIEHGIKQYNTIPPKDPQKWAEICEHIIRHYTEGWADGFEYDMKYWEIWNEPDGAPNWTGSDVQFFDLYITAARHLKKCFPKLMIGGPSVCSAYSGWNDRFLSYISNKNGVRTPLDFFSWHGYTCDPHNYAYDARHIREILDKFGYNDAESHLAEWNYMNAQKTPEEKCEAFKIISNEVGAAFTASTMCVCENESADMLMYYDARPATVYNGVFGRMGEAKKSYYAFLMFSRLYKLGTAVKSDIELTNGKICGTAAKDSNGNGGILLSYFSDDKNADTVTAAVEISGFTGSGSVEAKFYLLDREQDDKLFRTDKTNAEVYSPVLKMQPNSVVYIELAMKD